MTPEETLGQLLGLGKAWRVVEARLEALMFVLKEEETPDLWPEESARAGTPVICYDHVQPMPVSKNFWSGRGGYGSRTERTGRRR
jgi:hypothetical protein